MTNPNVRPDLTELTALLKAATPTPWGALSTQTEGEDRGVGIIGLRLDEGGEPMFTPTNGIVAAALPCPTEIDSNDYTRVEANAALLVGAVNALPDLIAHIERLEATLQRIADDGPATDPGPAYDDGWVSHGNYDDVAHDSRQEVRWAHAQLARATLSQGTSHE